MICYLFCSAILHADVVSNPDGTATAYPSCTNNLTCKLEISPAAEQALKEG
jgi:hypothetical protein